MALQEHRRPLCRRRHGHPKGGANRLPGLRSLRPRLGTPTSRRLKRFSDSPCTAWPRHGTSACINAGGPMRAYSMDLRERALLDSDAGMKAADVAEKYRVSGSWVRLLNGRRRTAPARDRRGRAARPATRPAPHARAAPAHVGRTDCGTTGSHSGGAEGRARHAGESGDDLARRAGPGRHRQKKTIRPAEHDRPDVAAARVAWQAQAPTWDPTRLVFLDETGVTNNLLRRYGRALRGARVHDHAPCARAPAVNAAITKAPAVSARSARMVIELIELIANQSGINRGRASLHRPRPGIAGTGRTWPSRQHGTSTVERRSALAFRPGRLDPPARPRRTAR